MDVSRTRVVLRERAVIDVLDLALRFVAEHAALYARGAAVTVAPLALISIGVAHLGGWLAGWLFALFAGSFAAAPFTVLASRLVFEDDVRWSSAFATAARLFPGLFALRLVTFVVGGLGLAFFFVPGMWFLGATLFVGEVTLLERASLRGALTRSFRMTRREASLTLVAWLLLALLHGLATVGVDVGGRTVVSALLESRAPLPVWQEGGSVLALLGFWLFVPYVATARFFVYLDVRTRSEGWDIQTRFTALASRAPVTESSHVQRAA